jgi:hypothetical protein
MYKAILLTEGEKFSDISVNKLNKYFDEGWIYVHSINQTLSVDGAHGRTIVILKLKEQPNVI